MIEKKTTMLKKRIKTEKGLWNPLCYDCVSAKIFDKAGADLIAAGDSRGAGCASETRGRCA